jgi:hypothetical protein
MSTMLGRVNDERLLHRPRYVVTYSAQTSTLFEADTSH